MARSAGLRTSSLPVRKRRRSPSRRERRSRIRARRGRSTAGATASSSFDSQQMATGHAEVYQTEAERDCEDNHRERRRVAKAEVLEQRAEGVERDRLGRGAWATAGEHVDQVEDAERVERAKRQGDHDGGPEERQRDLDELVPGLGAVNAGGIV